MNKRFLLTLFALASSLILAACQPNTPDPDSNNSNSSSQSSSSQEELTIEELFEQVKDANEDVESLHFDMSIENNTNGTTSTQEMETDVAYNTNNQEVKQVDMLIEETKNGATASYQHDIWTGDSEGTMFSKKSETEDWTKLTGASSYNIKPDYFRLLDIIYSMEDDFELEENDDNYTLSLRSQSIDLVGKFSEELSMYITGVNQTEVEKEFEVTFDKETLYLTDFSIVLDYDGDKGKLNITAKGDYSDINEVDSSAFNAPE